MIGYPTAGEKTPARGRVMGAVYQAQDAPIKNFCEKAGIELHPLPRPRRLYWPWRRASPRGAVFANRRAKFRKAAPARDRAGRDDASNTARRKSPSVLSVASTPAQFPEAKPAAAAGTEKDSWRHIMDELSVISCETLPRLRRARK